MRGEIIVLSVRIGVATMDSSLPVAALLLQGSEIALHAAKSTQSRAIFYKPEMEEQARQAHRLENDLRVSLVNRHVELHRALANDEFQIHYQPIIDCKTGRFTHSKRSCGGCIPRKASSRRRCSSPWPSKSR
ncbi:hypothetical protein V5O39_09150 [Pseudomonas parakoreensis]